MLISSNTYSLCTDGDGGIHQLAVIVIEIVFEFDAIGVFEFNSLVTLLVIVRVDYEFEIARLHFRFVEHPFVEKQVFVAGGGHHKGDGATLGARNGLARLVDGLMKLVGAFHYAVSFLTYGQVALECHGFVVFDEKECRLGKSSLFPKQTREKG